MSNSYSNVVSSMLKELKSGLDHTPISDTSSVGSYVVAKESFSPENAAVATNGLQGINALVSDVLTAVGVSGESFTAAQRDAASKIAALSLNPNAALGAVAKLSAGSSSVLPSEIGVEDYLDFSDLEGVTVSQEAYDGQKKDNCFLFSVAYNLVASKQDEFGEAFYPTIVVDPTVSEVVMEIKFASLMNELQRPVDGSANRGLFNKVPLPKAIYNPDIFATDKNKIVPVVRTETEKFLLTSEKRVDKSTLETVETAPLLFGETINLLGIGQTDTLLSRGQMDNTDALDRAISLESVYVSLTGDAATEIFKINTSAMSFNAFTFNPQGHNKDFILNFNNQVFTFDTKETKTSKGAASTVLEALPEGYKVDVEVSISGTVNTQYGDVELYGVKSKVVRILNAAGDELNAAEADYKSIAKVFETFKFLAYDLLAYTTNSNLRKRGQLVTVDSFKQPYMVPVRSGIMSIVPVNNDLGTDNDTDALIGQAQVCGAKISMGAVEALVSHADIINQITAGGTKQPDLSITESGFKGIAKNVLNPAFEHRTIDLLQIVSSLDSKSRDESIRAALLQQIYNVGVALYLKSNYGVVFERVINGASSARPTLIVGTDPNIKRLLVTESSGDTIQLGTMFDIKIVSTFNQKIAGKIYLSFGVFDQQRNSVPNPLNHGNCAFSPNVVYDLVRTLNGQTSRERLNQPRYLHITHLPVIGVFDVTNVEEVFGQIVFKMRNV